MSAFMSLAAVAASIPPDASMNWPTAFVLVMSFLASAAVLITLVIRRT